MSLEVDAIPAARFPNWVMLERIVFRRDDDSFPDESKAPIRATGKTTWGAQFCIAFDLAKPPLVSRLYAQLPTFPKKQLPLAILATDRHLSLFRVGTKFHGVDLVQDFFIYNASATDPSKSLTVVPRCTEPDMDYSRLDGHLPRKRTSSKGASATRLLMVKSMGLLCRDEEEFAVAELRFYMPTLHKIFADIYLYSSSAGKWDSLRSPIHCNPDVIEHACLWDTDRVMPFDPWLCWIDYERGILFYDVFERTSTSVFFRLLPLDEFPYRGSRSKKCRWLYRSVSAIDAGGPQRALMYIDVARNDGIGYGALKPGTGFTITCYTLKLGSSKDLNTGWVKEYTVTSDELWSANPERLPQNILMFPQVNIDRPHVVHFQISEYEYVKKKTWLVTIDMNSRKVESFSQYTNGRDEVDGTEGAYLTELRSSCPMSFLPCEFTKYLNFPSIYLLHEEEGEGDRMRR